MQAPGVLKLYVSKILQLYSVVKCAIHFCVQTILEQTEQIRFCVEDLCWSYSFSTETDPRSPRTLEVLPHITADDRVRR